MRQKYKREEHRRSSRHGNSTLDQKPSQPRTSIPLVMRPDFKSCSNELALTRCTLCMRNVTSGSCFFSFLQDLSGLGSLANLSNSACDLPLLPDCQTTALQKVFVRAWNRRAARGGKKIKLYKRAVHFVPKKDLFCHL